MEFDRGIKPGRCAAVLRCCRDLPQVPIVVRKDALLLQVRRFLLDIPTAELDLEVPFDRFFFWSISLCISLVIPAVVFRLWDFRKLVFQGVKWQQRERFRGIRRKQIPKLCFRETSFSGDRWVIWVRPCPF